LNLLGSREPDVYGSSTLSEIVELAAGEAKSLGLEVEHRHSNQASQLVEWIQQAEHEAIVINPGAFTHYAWSIHDALAAYDGVVVELHLSNPANREEWRHTSVVSPVADGVVAGFGATGYRLAVRAVAMLLEA